MPPQDYNSLKLGELAAKAAGGDEAAFATLYHRLHGGVKRFIQRRGATQPDVIEEVAQHAWVEVWRGLRLGRYDPDRGAVTTFIYAIAFHTWLHHQRERTQRKTRDFDASFDDLFYVTDVDQMLYHIDLLDALRECLRDTGLTADERAVIDGLLTGQSERQLAETIGLAASTVNTRKKGALAKIQQCLHSKGFDTIDLPTERPPSAEE